MVAAFILEHNHCLQNYTSRFYKIKCIKNGLNVTWAKQLQFMRLKDSWKSLHSRPDDWANELKWKWPNEWTNEQMSDRTNHRRNEQTKERTNERKNDGCCLYSANLTIVLHIGKPLFFHNSPVPVSFFFFIFMSSNSAKEKNTLNGIQLWRICTIITCKHNRKRERQNHVRDMKP